MPHPIPQREGSVPSQQGDPPRDPPRDLSPPLPPGGGDAPPPARRHPIILSAKKRTTDQYGIAARLVTRVHNMNWEPFAVVTAGIDLIALGDECAKAADAEYNRQQTRNEPCFAGTRKWDVARHCLDNGKSAAQSEDNHTLKGALPKWMKWDPPLKSNSKSDRGLNHTGCARHLAPISVDWNDKMQRNNFLIGHDPPMTATQHWPALLYLNLNGNVNNMAVGLLHGELLVKGARAIIFPASVANSDEEPDHRSNQKSKADTYGMTMVMPGFLAYVAVGVQYALSSETLFMSTGGLFNYELFYNNIVSYLAQPECKVETDELIKWWNSKLFPPKEANPAEEPEGLLAELIRQAEARWALEHDN